MPMRYVPFNAKRFDKDLGRLMSEAMREAAEDEAREQADAVSQGMAADGTRQKANQGATTKRKGGKGPLVDSGTLGEASAYVVQKSGADGWSLMPPRTRVEVLGHLAALGYAVWRVPSGVVRVDSRRIREQLKRLRPRYQEAAR